MQLVKKKEAESKQLSKLLKKRNNNENSNLKHWSNQCTINIYLIIVYKAVNYTCKSKWIREFLLTLSDWIHKILNQPLNFIPYFNLISKPSTICNHGKFTFYFILVFFDIFLISNNTRFCIDCSPHLSPIMNTTFLFQIYFGIVASALYSNFVDDLRSLT